MSVTVMINLLIFISLMFLLARLADKGLPLSQRVLTSLLIGAAFGLALQFVYNTSSEAIAATLEWSNVVGSGYVSLLKMIVMPLILVSMIAAVIRMEEIATLGKIGGMVIGILIATTMIASLVAITVTNLFGLTAEGLTQGARELARAEVLEVHRGTVTDLSLPQIIISFIPQNIFADLAGSRPTSIISVVIFGILTGIAGLLMTRDEPEQGERFKQFVETALNVNGAMTAGTITSRVLFATEEDSEEWSS